MYSKKARRPLANDMQVDLWRLTDKDDPTFRSIREMRDRYKPDVVHLITMRDVKQNDNSCGWGWIVQDLGRLRDWGFSTSNRQCALQNFSFVHEVGHNLGMNHARGDPGVTPKPGEFNFGYVLTARCQRSVMAYDDTCKDSCSSQPGGCRRLNIFSSPNLRYPDGTAFGRPSNDPMAAYNAEVLCRAGTVLKNMRR
jgi:Metallo-peptidase family M12B Reprolysin-like